MGSPVGTPIDMVQIPCCDDSLMSGFWPHPSRREFYIKKETPWKTKKNLHGQKFYDFEKEMFFYSGNKEIPLKNRYDVQSEHDEGDEETYTDQHGCLYSFSNCANCLNFDFDCSNCLICLKESFR